VGRGKVITEKAISDIGAFVVIGLSQSVIARFTSARIAVALIHQIPVDTFIVGGS
jgi:hypothetical protein